MTDNDIIIDVNTGEIKFGGRGVILRSNALGSCIAVVAHNKEKAIGVLAHVMLPGRSPDGCEKNMKYAVDAIDEMANIMMMHGVNSDGIAVYLVGAANVLERDDDAVCCANIESVTRLLDNKNIKVKAMALGGTKRRSITFDVGKGEVLYSEGDSDLRVLR